VNANNEQSLGEAIREFLHAYDLDQRLGETRVIRLWEKVVGAMVARHTKNLYVRNRILFARIDSSALRNELNYSRERITKMLNEAVRENVIQDVVFQ
jgi:predicted nucleic acid-binding Zn ribbon protein